MILDLLMALVNILWCFAQLPVTLLGRILPLSVKYFCNFLVSL